MNVKLTATEVALAANVGIKRWEAATLSQREDSGAALSVEDSLLFHIQGAAGELAAAKALDLYAPLHVNEYRSGRSDLGYGIEVRYTPKETNSLFLKEWDKDDRVFILVRGKIPELNIVGWIKGSEGKLPQFKDTRGNQLTGYFVDDSSLHGIGSLKNILLDYFKIKALKEILNG